MKEISRLEVKGMTVKQTRNINLTKELIDASKKDYTKNLVNLSERVRGLLRKYYKNKGFL